jgi:hypothetical protein
METQKLKTQKKRHGLLSLFVQSATEVQKKEFAINLFSKPQVRMHSHSTTNNLKKNTFYLYYTGLLRDISQTSDCTHST